MCGLEVGVGWCGTYQNDVTDAGDDGQELDRGSPWYGNWQRLGQGESR